MTEILVESVINETVIDIVDGPTLSTTVDEVLQTVVQEFADPIVIDLNSGPRGEPGAAILVGAYPPSGFDGVMGDMYIVTQGSVLVGQVFRKTGTVTWTDVGNVRGPAGGVNTVNGETGPDVVLDKADIGLGNVDNTSDLLKPISTATQTALDSKIYYGDWLQSTNPFNNARRLYLNELHNTFFRAADRWTVVGKVYNADNTEYATLTAAETRLFFDGNYESTYYIPNGKYLLLTVTFPNEALSRYPGYPYGYFIVSHYYNNKSSANSARVFTEYAAHGGPAWKDLPKEEPVNLAASYVLKFRNSNYDITTVEFRIDSPATGNTAGITQIEMQADRVQSINELPYVDKYRNNSLYSTTSWKEAGVVKASVQPTGVITATQFYGGGGNITGLNGTNISAGTVADARLSSNQATLSGTQSFTGSKTFTSSITAAGMNLTGALNIAPAGNASIELGRVDGTSSTPFFDFHSGAVATDYDARIIASGGTGTIAGGTLTYNAASHVFAGVVSGNGSGLTTLNGTNISTGTVADARLSTNVVLANTVQTLSGKKHFSDTLVAGSGSLSATVPSGSATSLTPQIVANNSTFAAVGVYSNDGTRNNRSGLFIDDTNSKWGLGHTYSSGGFFPFVIKFGSTETLSLSSTGVLATGAINLTGNMAAAAFSGSGANLTALNGTNISSGTVADARLSTNVLLATGAQTVSGIKTFTASPIVPAPTTDTQAAHKKYVDDRIAALVNGAGSTLDTLNELAAALGNDANFATTVTNQIAAKQDTIVAGTTAQYYRGDKTWQTLNPTAVGLSNITNTTKVDLTSAQTIGGVKTFTSAPVVPDAAFAIAKVSGLQAALDLKAPLASPTFTGIVTGTFDGNGGGLTGLNGNNISTGTVSPERLGNAVIRVFHGGTASTARPTATYVEWVGYVAPTNATTSDTWVNTA